MNTPANLPLRQILACLSRPTLFALLMVRALFVEATDHASQLTYRLLIR
jgi:hypothetical protein